MKIVDIRPERVILTFDLTDTEVDDISLALSIAEIRTSSPEEVQAAKTLTAFSQMLNDLLERARTVTNGRNS
jgi:hypothetical protein